MNIPFIHVLVQNIKLQAVTTLSVNVMRRVKSVQFVQLQCMGVRTMGYGVWGT